MGIFKRNKIPEPPLPRSKEEEQKPVNEEEIPEEVKEYMERTKNVIPPPPIKQQEEDEEDEPFDTGSDLDSDEEKMQHMEELLLNILETLQTHNQILNTIKSMLVDVWYEKKDDERQ